MVPLISIIIPHFNSVDSLEQLLNSIGKHADVEVLVVDDKSTQDLKKLARCKKKYTSDSCLFLANTTSKKGAGISRNIGLQNAKGRWLLFADADDLFVENWYLVVKKYLNSTSDIVYFPPSGQGKRQAPYTHFVMDYLQHKPNAENRLRFQFFPPWSKLIRHSLVKKKKIIFDETQYSNDVMFSTQCGFYARRITADSYSIYFLQERENSLTKNKKFEALYIRSEVICRTYQFLHDHLDSNTFKTCYVINAPLADLWTLIKGRYSFKQIVQTYQLYNEYHIPVFVSSNIKKITAYLWKSLAKQKRRKYES